MLIKRRYSDVKKVKNMGGERTADLSALRVIARCRLKIGDPAD